MRGDRWFSLAESGKITGQNAWLLTQHADLDPSFQEHVLSLMKPMVDAGEVNPQHYAYLYDRIAVKQKRPQLYGTPWSCKDGRAQPQGVEIMDLNAVEPNRAAIGLQPLAAYGKKFEKYCRKS